jgi:hypothetical protein
LHQLELRVIASEQPATAVWMPRQNPNGKIMLAKLADNATAEKPGSAEYSDSAIVRVRHRST